jgi:hypothetical protein
MTTMLRPFRISTLVAISLGLSLGFGAALCRPTRQPEKPSEIDAAATAPIQFVDNSGICCPDDVGCFDEAGRAMLLTGTKSSSTIMPTGSPGPTINTNEPPTATPAPAGGKKK